MILALALAAVALIWAPAASAASTYTVEDCGSLGNTQALTWFSSNSDFSRSTTGCGGGSTGLAVAPDGLTTNMALGDRAYWVIHAPSGESITGLGTVGGSYHSGDGWISGWAMNGLIGDDPLPSGGDCITSDQMQSCSTRSSGWVSVPNGSSVQMMIRCDASSTTSSTYCQNSSSEVGAEVATAVVQLSDPSNPAITASGTLWDAGQGSGLTDGWISGINVGSLMNVDFSASNPGGICRLEAVLTDSSGATVASSTLRAVSPSTDSALGSKFGVSAPFASALPCGAAATGTGSFAPDLSGLPTGVYHLNVEAQDPAQHQGGTATYATGTSLAAGYPIAIDNSVPTVGIATGTTAGEWYTGPRTVTVTADDAAGSSGLKSVTCAAQGTVKTYAVTGDHGTVSLSLSQNGQDTVECYAISAAGNVSKAALATVNIDNDPPQLQLSDGPSQSTWYRTTQQLDATATAIGGTDMKAIVCTIGGTTRTYLASSGVTGESVQISVPAPGGTLVCHAVDTAGNQSADSSWRFRIDDTRPTAVFERRSSGDPTLLRLHVADSGSGVGWAQIQIRTAAGWRNLRTSLHRATGLASARVPDDGSLPNGTYAVRALVADVAGNSIDTRLNWSGADESVTLPLRKLTRVRASISGDGARVVAATARRSHVLRLRRRSRLHIAGVLRTRAGVPVSHATIWVLRRVAGRTRFRTLGRTRTNAAGDFSFTAPGGPSGTIRVVYRGSRRMRMSVANTRMRVRGSVRLKVRRIVRAGSRTSIGGKVLGGYIPAGGVLVQLWYTVAGQRSGWEPFEHAIRARRGGRFHIRFRVPAAARNFTYRFRAVVARQHGWPYLATRSAVRTRRFR